MAYDGWSTSNFLASNSAPITAVPLTITYWFRSTDIDTAQTAVGILKTGSNWVGWWGGPEGNRAGDPVRANTRNTTFVNADSPSGYSADTWHLGAIIYPANDSRFGSIDAGGYGTEGTDSETPTGNNHFMIGAGQRKDSPLSPMIGALAEVGFFDTNLSEATLADMYNNNKSPLFFSDNLVSYVSLNQDRADGGLQDELGATTFTTNGTPTEFTHPEINYPGGIVTGGHFMRRARGRRGRIKGIRRAVS